MIFSINKEQTVKIQLDNYSTVIEVKEGTIYVTRPSITEKISTHAINSSYGAVEIALWLRRRLDREPNAMVQDAFPDMSPEDREFLMTGITPQEWKELFDDPENELGVDNEEAPNDQS